MSEARNGVTFSELIKKGILEIGDGYRAKLEELGGSGPLFLRAGLLTEQGITWGEAERFHIDLTSRLATKLGKPGDTIVTTKGNSIGRTGYIPSNAPSFVYSPHLSYWRSLDLSRLSPAYLKYWSRSSEFTEQLQAMADSTDMAPYLSLTDQRRLRMTLPSITVQKRIGEVLSVLDDKIAVNHQIARVSLDLADALFEAESVGLGFAPETFASVATVSGGGTPRTSEPMFWDGDIAWATPTDITALSSPYLFNTARTITELGLANCASQLYPQGSILMTSRATIGSFAIVQVPVAVNQGFIVVAPSRGELQWWLFHEMRSRMDEMLSLANGSTFLELSRKNFKAMHVRIPSVEDLARFDAKVSPLHRRAAHAAQESAILAELRGTLLTRLMSGEIRVQNAEKAIEEAT